MKRVLVACGNGIATSTVVASKIREYAENAGVLLHEAFCLYEERDFRVRHEKHHSTVKDACELAQKLHIKNLVLYHTEDDHVDNRKELYKAEGSHYYTGNIFVPDDLEVMEF